MHVLRSPRESALVALVVLAAGALVLTFARAQSSGSITLDNVRVESADTTSTTAKVRWATSSAAGSSVTYGTSSASLSNSSTTRCDEGGNVVSHCVELPNLAPGTTYYYRAYSSNDSSSGVSDILSFTTTGSSGGGSGSGSVALAAPGTPVPSAYGTVTPGTSVSFYAMLYSPGAAGTYYEVSQQAVFDWGDGTTYGYSGYVTPAPGSSQPSPSVSHTFSTTGTFAVRAKAKAQNDTRESAGWSPVYNITVQAGSGDTAPSAPTSLSQVGSGVGAIQLQWLTSSLANVSSFKLERRVSGQSWSVISSAIASTAATYTDTTVTTGTTYDYRIQACSSSNACSDYATVWSVVAQAASTTAPAAPTNFRLDPAPTNSAVYLKWNDISTTEDSFKIERELAGTTSWTVLTQAGAGVTSHTDTTVTAGASYSYRIRACLADTCSGYLYLTSVSVPSTTNTSGNTAPPRITATYPGHGANGVGLAATAITITFDQAMQASSLSWTNVTLQQMSGSEPTSAGKGSVVVAVNGAVAYSSTSLQGSFIPASALVAGTVYQLTVASGASGVQSLTGLQLDGNGDGTAGDSFVALFKTAAATQASGSRTVSGRVVNASGASVSGINVYAYAPQAGFSTSASSGTGGGFSLTLPQGSFIVGAYLAGTSVSPQLSIEVAGDNLFVGGATTAVALPNTAAPFTITVAQAERTISGVVSDGTNPVSGASVWAYRTDGAGGAQASTSATGSYVLYVAPGTWRIGANVPSIGPLPEITRSVGTSDLVNVNFTATAATFAVSGRVYQDTNGNSAFDEGEAVPGAIVRIEGTTLAGTSFGNDVAADTTGSYVLRVPPGTYRLKGWSSSLGQLSGGEPFAVTANVVRPLRVVPSRAITVNFVSGDTPLVVERAYVDFLSTSGAGNHLVIENSSTGILQLPAGTYTVRAGVEGSTPGSITFSGAGVSGSTVTVGAASTTITVNVPSRRTINVTVTDTQGVLVERAWVDLVSASTGARTGGLTDAQGRVVLEAAEGAYQIAAVKPGYLGAPTALTVSAATSSATAILRRAAVLISGRVTTPTGSAAHAFIRAERVDEVGIAGKQVEADGTYELPLAPGRWRLYAVADGYAEVALSELVEVSSTAITNKNIALTTGVTIAPLRVEPVVPASGGIVQHDTAGVTLTIPAQALGTGTSSSQVQVRETNSVIKTATTVPVGGKGVDVTATDSTGKAITSLSKAITIELSYDPALVSTADVKKLALAYWDEAAGGWVSVGGVVDATTHTLRANVTHLTVFTIVLPFIATPASAASPAAPVDERAAQLQAITAEATAVRTATAEALAQSVGAQRDTSLEQSYDASIVARVVVAGTSTAIRAQVLNFVTYGTPTTKKLGAGERAGVVNSFRTAFGRLPASDADWQDVLKIANGRFPGSLSAARESAVASTFQRIYARSANRAQANDDAAVTIMAYGLRSATRNLGSEAAALITFRAIFGNTPVTAADWDAVRAIAYSGAKR